MREYKRIKNQVSLDELDNDEESSCNHKYGFGNIPSLTVDEREETTNKIDTKSLLKEIKDETDRKICEMIINDETITDISKELNMPRPTIYKRLAKYREVFKNFKF